MLCNLHNSFLALHRIHFGQTWQACYLTETRRCVKTWGELAPPSFLIEVLELVPKDVATLIDVGCGRGIIGALMKIYRPSASRLVCLDGFKPYLRFCKQHNFYEEYLNLNLTLDYLPFRSKEFDVAVCLEVIEHLPRQSGERLLNELERIAKKVIISTPNRYLKQGHFDNNPLQTHLSEWKVSDFNMRGYKVRGVNVLKFNLPYIRFFFAKFGWIFPSLSHTLLAYKEATARYPYG